VGLVGLGLLALGTAVSACGASSALGSAVLAPLSALPATDVVFETNLQSAVEGGQAQTSLSGISGANEVGGLPETSGAPTAAGEVSAASVPGASVYTAFNPADRHCLGTLVIASGAAVTVLSETSPGSYDFWFGPTTAADCTASVFAAEPAASSVWASGDPSSTGWPGT
jgi:hypothetical protein